MIVIGLTGKAGAGKSTVADHLVEAHGFTKLSFAGPLKKMLRTLDPHVAYNVRLSSVFEAFNGDEVLLKASLFGPEYRRLLQVLGTDCIRAVDEDFWAVAAMQQLTDLDGKYVFDDVRFPNEAEAVRSATRNGLNMVWNVRRPNHADVAGAHESEEHAGRMHESVVITNYSSKVEVLHQLVDHLIVQYALGKASA